MDLEGKHESLWVATAPGSPHPRLDEDVRVDVAVVGGGIVGVTTAYLLQQRGRSVAVLDAHRVLRGVTGHTTAKLTSQHGVIYHGLADRLGNDRARLHGEANEAAKAWVREQVEALELDAALVRAPAFVYTTDHNEAERLRREARAARDLGLPASFVTETELPFAVAGAVRFDDQAHLHPRKYLLGLLRAFQDAGGLVFEESPVVAVEGGTPCRVRTQRSVVTADDVVVATNVPINDNKYFVTRMKPVRAYGVAMHSGVDLEGMYISADGPVRSVRRFDDGVARPVLVFVGDNHPVGHGTDTGAHHRNLVAFALDHFDVEDVAYRWSTQDYYPFDGLPYVGRAAPGARNVWTATGFQGWGMSQGTAAGLMIADAVTGRDNPWLDLYDPFAPARVARDLVRPKLIRQQGHIARMFLEERMRRHEATGLAPGDGAVVDVDGTRLALHCDQAGELHARGATCTHMGCIVSWNRGEQSWDCPCHGSRFAATDGTVLHGPATSALPERDVTEAVRREARVQRGTS